MLVLVVDDDRAVRESLERALQLHGYEVALAADGDAALAAVEARTPDAVVLDVMMPGLDGLDVTRRLRRRLPAEAVRPRGAPRAVARPPAPLEARAAGRAAALRRPDPRPGLDGRAPGRAPLRADHHRGAPARAVHAQPTPGAAAPADLRARLGLRLQPLLERARRLRRLPAPQDRGGRGATADPHRPRHGLRAARAVTLKARLTLVAAGVVAVVVALASTATYFLMRHELYSQVDAQLTAHARDPHAAFSDLSPFSSDFVAVVNFDGTVASNPHNIP